MSVGGLGLVVEASSRRETAFDFGPEAPQPPARGKGNTWCWCLKPGGVQILESWYITINHLLRGGTDTLQPAFLLGGGSGVPDGDAGGDDGLHHSDVKVHHLCPWQVELVLWPQEVHPVVDSVELLW